MLHLELPHINVLSKVDLLTQYGDLGIHLLSLSDFEFKPLIFNDQKQTSI